MGMVLVDSWKKAQFAAERLIAVGQIPTYWRYRWLKPFVGKHVGAVESLTGPDRLPTLAEADMVKLDSLHRDNRGETEKSA